MYSCVLIFNENCFCIYFFSNFIFNNDEGIILLLEDLKRAVRNSEIVPFVAVGILFGNYFEKKPGD